MWHLKSVVLYRLTHEFQSCEFKLSRKKSSDKLENKNYITISQLTPLFLDIDKVKAAVVYTYKQKLSFLSKSPKMWIRNEDENKDFSRKVWC